ncbi:MAG: DUF3231 family protein [Limnochordia bacterium]
MVFTFFKKPETRQGLVDVRETFNLWEILKSKYNILELSRSWLVFVHDPDLQLLIRGYVKELDDNKRVLERLMEKYQISGPDQGRLASNWAGNTEALRDETIAGDLFIYMQEHVDNLLRTVRTSVTNDEVRHVMMKLMIKTLTDLESLTKYLKVKGWLENVPIYPNTPPENHERIDCATAAHLWDHTTFRYDSLRKTKYYRALTHDLDFRAILSHGMKVVEEQIEKLERECINFGIPLPKRPAEVIAASNSSDFFCDDFMYRDILIGLQGATLLHSEAIKQVIFNDRIRQTFRDMIIKEIGFYEDFIKFGKAKGWLHPIPSYKI